MKVWPVLLAFPDGPVFAGLLEHPEAAEGATIWRLPAYSTASVWAEALRLAAPYLRAAARGDAAAFEMVAAAIADAVVSTMELPQ